MPLEGSYAIWNNRGGSGKTNITYHLAIKYAYRNPDKTVLVVDMCPQTDLSHAFLGKIFDDFALIKVTIDSKSGHSFVLMDRTDFFGLIASMMKDRSLFSALEIDARCFRLLTITTRFVRSLSLLGLS